MAARTLNSPLVSRCVACLRRLTYSSSDTPRQVVSHIQTRGKKKMTKGKYSIPVRLLEDLPGYGRKGSLVPMGAGQMRNLYFPRRKADYIPFLEFRELKKRGITLQRDFTFGTLAQDSGAELKDESATLLKPIARPTKQAEPVRVDLNLFSPNETFAALDRLLPPTINFYRTPNPRTEPTKGRDITQVAASGVSPAPQSRDVDTRPTVPIYGSVSAADIATNIKALLTASEETAGRVVLGEDDIILVDVNADGSQSGPRVEAGRIKRLGDYEFEIKIRGHDRMVRRQVSVQAEDEAPVDPAVADEVLEILAGENPIAGDVAPKVVEAEARADTALEELERLARDARELLEQSRVATMEPYEPTPAEKAEIDMRGDVAPPRREIEGVLSLEDEQSKRRSPQPGEVEKNEVRY